MPSKGVIHEQMMLCTVTLMSSFVNQKDESQKECPLKKKSEIVLNRRKFMLGSIDLVNYLWLEKL